MGENNVGNPQVRQGGVHYPCGIHINQKDAVMARDRK
jgi:hypothetical protein